MVKVLYLPSAGRSGSTLLDRLLGQLDGVFGAGELSWVWQKGLVEDGKCGCGVPLRECPVWNEVFDRAFGGMDAVDGAAMMALWHSNRIVSRRFPLLLTRGGRRRLATASPEATAALAALYRSIHEVTGCKVIVDASKNAFVPAFVSRVDGVLPYVAQLLRDPRAVAYSWWRPKPELGFGEDALMDRNGTVKTAAWWVLTNEATRLVGETLAPRYRHVRYEDLAATPRETLEGLARFVGETWDLDALLDGPVARLEPTHTVWGNPIRFRSGPVTLRLDERWATDMPARERRTVSVLTAPWRRRYGYSGSDGGDDGGARAAG
jgi:hypothetical protein